MKIIKREMTIAEQILLMVDKAQSEDHPTERADYIILTLAEYDKLYADVATGVLPMSLAFVSDLSAKRSVMGLTLKIQENWQEPVLTPVVEPADEPKKRVRNVVPD